MIKVSTTGMEVSLKTDLRFPIPGQQGQVGRIIQVMRFFSTQMYCEGSEELMEQHALEPSQIQIRQGKEKKFMRNVIAKLDMAVLKAKTELMQKKEASDQLIVMFIIIAVAAGIAGLLYIFATGTLLPNFQTKLTNLINNWFNHS